MKVTSLVIIILIIGALKASTAQTTELATVTSASFSDSHLYYKHEGEKNSGPYKLVLDIDFGSLASMKDPEVTRDGETCSVKITIGPPALKLNERGYVAVDYGERGSKCKIFIVTLIQGSTEVYSLTKYSNKDAEIEK